MQRLHPVAWVVFNLTLGLIAGLVLSWGPLAAPAPFVLALAAVGALGGAAIALWSQRRARQRHVLYAHGVIVIAVALATLVPLYRVGMIALPDETRAGNFERLWRAMDYAYPYFTYKNVDWTVLRADYAPQAAAAASDDEYWRIVASMLAELNDGHTGLVSPSMRAGRHYFATCRALGDETGGAIVVDEVGMTARASGVERGDVVLAVDGRPVESALAALPPTLRAGSTSQQRRAKAAFSILSTTEDTLSVTLSGRAGERTVMLSWPVQPPAPAQAPATANLPLITAKRLPSGRGLIRIPTFENSSNHNLVAEFDAALAGLLDAPAIILDLRGNGGGSTFISDPIAARFLERPFTYGRDLFRARLPQRGWRDHFDYRVTPRGDTYSGPLVLLIDETNYSTAENFIVALVDAKRATTVGRRTAGGSGNPLTFTLTGGAVVRFSTGFFQRIDGTPIEGVGIAPDVPITWTVEDYRLGRDPDLEAAERLWQ